MARKVAMSPASSTPLSRSASSITTNFDDHSQSWSNNGAAYQPRPQAYEPSSRTNPRVNGIEYKSDLGPKRRLSRLKPDPLNISSKQRIFFEVAKSPYGIRSYSTEGCCWPKARNETESGVQEATNVLVSKRIIDLNRAHTVELHCLSETPEPLLSGNPQFRWLHMQSNPMDLEEFEKFALNSPGISGDLLDLCIALFDHIRENSLIKSGNSLQVEPGTVKQFRLQHADQIASESTSATFSSFPYLSTSAASPVKRHQDRRHRMRTLLEAFYQYESTCERDRKQALGKFFSNAGHKIIHVPQLWSLLLGSEFLITCSPDSVNEILGNRLVRITGEYAGGGPTVLRIKDPLQRLHSVPLRPRPTFFDIEHLLVSKCLASAGISLDECDICFGDGTAFTSSRWLELIQTHKGAMLEVDILPRDEDHAHSSLVEPSEGEQDLHMSLVLARKRSRPDLAYKNAAQRADAIQWHGSRASSRSRQSPKSSSRSLQSSMASMAPSVSRGRSSRYPRGKYEITPRNLALVRYRPRIGQTSAGHESLNPPGINAKAARSSVSDVTEMDAKVVLPRQAKTSLRGILINDQTRIQASRPKSPSLVYIRAADLGSADDIVEPMRSTVLNAPSSSAEKHIPTPKGAMHTGVDASDVEHDISTEQSDPSTVGPIENRIWEIASDGHIELLGAEPRRPPLILVDGLPQHAKRSHSEPRPTKEYEDVTYGTGPVRAGGILKTGTKVDRRSNVKKQDSGRVRFDTHTVLYTQDMSPDHEKATFEMGEPSDLRASRLAELPSNSSDWTANWVMNVASVPKSYTSSDPQTGVLDTSSTMFEEPDELQPEDQATTQVNGAIKSMDPTGSNPVQSSTSTSPVVRPKTIPLPAHVSDDDSDEARIYTENLGSEPILFEIPTTASTYGPTVATSKDQESFASESSIERRGRTSRTNPLRHGVRELYSSPSIASSSISDGEYEGLSSNESTTTRSGVLSRRRPNRRAIGSFSSDEDDRDHVHLSRRRQRQSRPIMSSSQASGSSKRSQSFHSEEERPRYDTDRTQHDRDRPRRRLSRVPEPPGVTIYNDSDDELPRGRRRRNSPRPGPTDWDDGATYHGADLSDRYSNTGPSYIDRTRRTHTDSRRPVNTFISDYNPFISDPTDYKHPDGHTFHNEYWYRSPSKRHYGSLYQDNYPYYDDDVYSLPHRSRYRSRSPDSPPYSSYGDHRVAAPYVHSQSRSRAARPNIANHRLPRAPTPPGYEERSYVSASQGPRIRNSAAYTRRSYKDDVRSELETVEGDLARLQEDQYLRSNSKSGPSSLAETQALEDDITELRLQLARLQPKSADPSWLEETEVATPTLPSLRERTGGHQNAESESVHVKVPPFFTWATYPGDVADPNDESAEAAILRKFDSLEYVLKGVRERLCANGRGAKIFNDVQLMSLEQFEDSHTDLLVQGSETSLDAPNGDQQPNETSNISPMILDDDAASSKIQNNITGNQSAKRALLKKDLLHITKDLFSLFVPLSHIHEVMSRYWGLLSNFCSILDVKEPAQSAREVWIVCFIENETEILGKFGLNAPSPALSECSDCANGRIYANERSGLRHLWYQHFVPTAGAQTAMLPPDALRNWLRSEEQLRIELSTIAISKILQVFLEHGRRFYARAKAIRNGVADSDKTKSAKYGLPPSLVYVFELELRSLLKVHKYVERVQHHFQQWQYSPGFVGIGHTVDDLTDVPIRKVQGILTEIDIALSEAERDFSIMAHSGSLATVSLASVGPEYILAAMIEQLRVRPLIDDLEDVDIYWHCTDRLQYQVHSNPGKRLLRDIQYVHEEVEILMVVNAWQKDMYMKMLKALDPASVPVTTYTRASLFPLEEAQLAAGITSMIDKDQELDAMKEKLLSLGDTAKQNIEIHEADHGKAIFVFTTVTIIFLPLSFVTSFFGMNTTDIRDITWSQTIFWATAVPITLLTVLLALGLAYKGDRISALIRRLHRTLSGRPERALDLSLSSWSKNRRLTQRRPIASYGFRRRRSSGMARAQTERSTAYSLA